MAFKGNENHAITRPAAKAMINKFQTSTQFKGIKGGFFGKDAIFAILSQTNCVGIRYYHAHDDKGQHTIVLVGEDNKGTCLSNGTLAEIGPLCPPFCPDGDPLDE